MSRLSAIANGKNTQTTTRTLTIEDLIAAVHGKNYCDRDLDIFIANFGVEIGRTDVASYRRVRSSNYAMSNMRD